jgi:hypothetical protein
MGSNHNDFTNIEELATFIIDHYKDLLDSGEGSPADRLYPDHQATKISQFLRKFPFKSKDDNHTLKSSNVVSIDDLNKDIYIKLINEELSLHNPSGKRLTPGEKMTILHNLAYPSEGESEDYVLKNEYQSKLSGYQSKLREEEEAFGGGDSNRNIVNKCRSSKRRSSKRRSSKRRSSKRRSSKRRSSKRRSSKRR